ncbi:MULTISPECIES: transcription termination factor NusA [unclassified Schaalia]|uniref:transcription termination factor NusA n=1 Tax=unclassified Schaalia TaxID=2691889 RepID=UPI001E5DC596|nr:MULTISPECIES: transcription termination factor NusA [unclassified Schaalia]MCD4549379.1 transcription termination factor NusA [Schaalia sp. lx-260]MCD4557939.1 transcription termination factor NusA [Schaalia sp. lx-100]
MEIDMTTLRVVEQEKGIALDTLVDAIEEALLKAYHNIPGAISQARIEIDKRTGRVSVLAMDEDEDGNPIGEFDDTPKNFGRIAQATARSVIMQRLRDADDQRVLGDFASRQGQIVTGVVQQSRDGRMTRVLLGDEFEAVLPDAEKAPGEFYRHGDRIRAYVVSVERTEKGPRITLSRTHPGLITGLFHREVPEIQQGLVEIKAVAREAGHRTKIAVAALREGVNAKGACIGPMGARVRSVMTELGGEKIDIVDYSEDPASFVANALSPARVARIVVHSVENRTATAVVPDFQLSLAIGKEGQNARLAARLTGYHIDIHSDTENGAQSEVSRSSMSDEARGFMSHPDDIEM